MYYAAAMHHRFGTPIFAAINPLPCGNGILERIIHCWVLFDDKPLDASGIPTQRYWDDCGQPAEIRQVCLSELESLCECELHPNNVYVRQATNELISP
jgi:hypothetical protein